MKNKKFIFAFLGIILVVFLVLPKFLGSQIEEQVRGLPNQKVMQDIMQVYGFGFEVTDYESGWFSSSATFQITVSDKFDKVFEAMQEQAELEGKNEIPPLVYTIPIKHGPVLFGEDGISFGAALMEGEVSVFGENVGIYEDLFELESGILETLPKPIASTRFGFTGNQSSFFLLTKGEWSRTGKNENTMTISWDRIESRTETDFSNERVDSNFSMPVLRMEGGRADGTDKGFIEILGVQGEFTYNLADEFPLLTPEGFIFMGKMEMDIPGTATDRVAFSVSDFREEVSILRGENPNIIGWRVPISVGEITYKDGGETKTPVTSFSLVIEVDNIGQRDVRDFYEIYFSMFENLGNYDDNQSERVAEIVKKAYLTLIKRGVRFDIPEGRAVTVEGDIDYSHTMQFPPVDDPENFIPDLWILGMTYNGDITFSPEFMDFMITKTLEQQLGPNLALMDEETVSTLKANTLLEMTLAGYLVANEDGSHSTNIVFENGVLLVNGNQIDLGPFLGGL